MATLLVCTMASGADPSRQYSAWREHFVAEYVAAAQQAPGAETLEGLFARSVLPGSPAAAQLARWQAQQTLFPATRDGHEDGHVFATFVEAAWSTQYGGTDALTEAPTAGALSVMYVGLAMMEDDIAQRLREAFKVGDDASWGPPTGERLVRGQYPWLAFEQAGDGSWRLAVIPDDMLNAVATMVADWRNEKALRDGLGTDYALWARAFRQDWQAAFAQGLMTDQVELREAFSESVWAEGLAIPALSAHAEQSGRADLIDPAAYRDQLVNVAYRMKAAGSGGLHPGNSIHPALPAAPLEVVYLKGWAPQSVLSERLAEELGVSRLLVPADGTLQRDVYPMLLFRREEGKLKLAAFTREFMALIRAQHGQGL